MKSTTLVLAVLVLSLLAACGNYSSPASNGSTTPVTYTIGGSISGLTGTGLVLQDNGGNNLQVSAGATSFTFTTALASGSSYSLTVFSQPSSPAQTCLPTSGSGTVASANITNIQIACTTTKYTIGGAVTNLVGTGGGLQLQNNGGDTFTVNANGNFIFATAITSGTIALTVSAQPTSPAQICGVTHATGTANANVLNVAVDCGHNEWTWVSGLNLVNQKGICRPLARVLRAGFPGREECCQLDRFHRKLLALWRLWVRFRRRNFWIPQRHLEVQRGPMDMEAVQTLQIRTATTVRRGRLQRRYSGRPRRCHVLDRSHREPVGLWRRRLRFRRDFRSPQRPLEV